MDSIMLAKGKFKVEYDAKDKNGPFYLYESSGSSGDKTTWRLLTAFNRTDLDNLHNIVATMADDLEAGL